MNHNGAATPARRALHVIVIGEGDAAEMRPAVAALDSLRQSGAIAHWQRAANAGAAVDLVESQTWFPDLAVVCQRWPREYSRQEVGRLFGLLPLTRWACCFGAWCESDGRNFDIWPHATRVPARCAAGRIRQEVEVILGRRAALPLTAGRDESFDYECESGGNVGVRYKDHEQRPVLLAVSDPALRRWLSELLSPHDTVSEELHSDRGDVGRPRVVIFDADPWNARTAAQLKNLTQRYPHAAVIALAALAHPEDAATLAALGAAATVTKLGCAGALLEVVALTPI